MVTVLTGLIGGLIATVVMTAFMMNLGDDSPPPTAVLWAKYIGRGEPEDYKMPGMAMHLLYGIVAGAIFVLVFVYGVVLGAWTWLSPVTPVM